ncbi:Reverse_transcriptase/endonuclease [Hexamita inflata]|uniref:Reverse transcriptase/endonuclease n=1 Tax=Hexamita inflata TaxID=28002 RepID=A0AA86NGK6_9EUKA|nr:Reverse transcriptase/endonuclease [Hexamita inflata]
MKIDQITHTNNLSAAMNLYSFQCLILIPFTIITSRFNLILKRQSIQQNTAMEAKGYQLTMFADDIQISHDPNVDKDVVLMELSELLQPQGLELALEKCSSTQNGGGITFLGQTFSQTSTSSLAERLTDKIDKCLKVLKWRAKQMRLPLYDLQNDCRSSNMLQLIQRIT